MPFSRLEGLSNRPQRREIQELMAVWPDLDPSSRTERIAGLFERYNQGIFNKDSAPYQALNVPTLKNFLSNACPRQLTNEELRKILRDNDCPEGQHWLSPNQATDAITAALDLCARAPKPPPKPKRDTSRRSGRITVYKLP